MLSFYIYPKKNTKVNSKIKEYIRISIQKSIANLNKMSLINL